MYYRVEDLDPVQQYVLQIKQNEVAKETLAERINQLEDLFALQKSIKGNSNKLALDLNKQIDKEIDDILKVAKANNVDISKTLMKYFMMKDSN